MQSSQPLLQLAFAICGFVAYLAMLESDHQLQQALSGLMHTCMQHSQRLKSMIPLVNAFTACRSLAGLLRALYLTDACLSQTTCYNGALCVICMPCCHVISTHMYSLHVVM